MNNVILILLLVASTPLSLAAQYTTRLMPPNDNTFTESGGAVSYNPAGDWFVVSRQNETVNGDEQTGAVYLYRYDNTWQLNTRLLAPLPRVHMSFGFATAMRGDVLLVGSADGMHIFRKDNQGNWSSEGLIARLLNARNEQFRPFDFITDNTVVFGSSVYEYIGGTWQHTSELSETGINALAMEDFIWIQQGRGTEVKYLVYKKENNGWNLFQEIDAFGGKDLSVHGNWAAFHFNDGGTHIVKTYKFDGSEWVFHSDISHNEATFFFAQTISLYGNRLLIGDWFYGHRVEGFTPIDDGIAYLYEYDEGSDTWGYVESYSGLEGEVFGVAVSLTDQAILVDSREGTYVFEAPAVATSNERVSSLEPELTIYPNPVTSHATITIQPEVSSRVQVRIYDMLGREVETLYNDYLYAGETKSIRFERGRYSSGAYVITIQAGASVSSQILIVN